MRFTTLRTILFGLALIALLIGQVGCALTPKGPPLLPSEELRANLGTIGVVSGQDAPKMDFEPPTSGKWSGTAKGAGAGFLGSIAAGLEAGAGSGELGGLTLALGIVLAPPAALVGAVVGAVKAEPAARVEEAEATLTRVSGNLNAQELMRDLVFQAARDQTRHHLVLLPNWGPTAASEEIRYRPLAMEGVDTILEISIPELGLPGGGINPPLPLMLSARARLVRVADGAELYARTWVHRSGTRKYTEWAANDAQPLRNELDRACQVLAERMVDDLFLLFSFPTEPAQGEEEPAPETQWRDDIRLN